MRNGIRLLASVLFALCPAAVAHAQTSLSGVSVYDAGFQNNGHFGGNYVNTYRCNTSTGQQPGGSSAGCAPAVINGSAYASTSSNNSSRSVSAATTLTQGQSNWQNSMTASSTAWSDQTNAILVSGTSGAGDNLVFHFQAQRSHGFLGTSGGTIQSFFQLYLAGAQGSGYVQGTDRVTSSSSFATPNAAATAIGLDFTIGFGSFTGSYGYLFESYVQTYLGGDQQDGAYGSSVYDVQLAGIDAIDAQGILITSATFQANGNATLDVTRPPVVTPSPEPATLTLFGSGVSLLAVLSLRQRRRVKP